MSILEKFQMYTMFLKKKNQFYTPAANPSDGQPLNPVSRNSKDLSVRNLNKEEGMCIFFAERSSRHSLWRQGIEYVGQP
jgi:hypothetical protein